MTSPRSTDRRLRVDHQTFTLHNGLTVTLAPDRRLPQVVVNTWFDVGSRDESAGRTGFAHLFEHLMFMGTLRVPGNQFDLIMETGGGANNASTSNDRTTYYSAGPSELLPTLLWLDADRLDALGASITQEKLDLQREVVRNELRQVVENTPYGVIDPIIPAALFPEGHPYHHPVIGSHADLEAATLEDVRRFFDTWYAPGNASLVIAGDFDPDAARAVVEQTFGAIPPRPVPVRRRVAPVALDGEVRRVATDNVELARLYLLWHTPPGFAPGAAEIELAAGVLAGGPSSRLERRLVQELRIAQSVVAIPDPRDLGSLFEIRVTAAPGADLSAIRRAVFEVVNDLAAHGPATAELERVKAQAEASFLRAVEDLAERADLLNLYRHHFGEADGFERDLDRYRAVTPARLREQVQKVFAAPCADVRVIPADAAVAGASLTVPPAPFAAGRFTPPVPEARRIACGPELHFVHRPGGLFAAHLVVDGGERIVPQGRAGLASLTATLMAAGAAGRSAAEFAEAVESLGAMLKCSALREAFDVGVGGLASRAESTLALFADALLRANLAAGDFERETARARARIEARADNPALAAAIAARRLVFGEGDHRGRALDGTVASVEGLTLSDVRAIAPALVDPRRAKFVLVGDVDPDAICRALDSLLAGWASAAYEAVAPRPALVATAPRRAIVPRPGAPQTVIHLIRPLPTLDDAGRAVRDALNVVLGGSFTSRLNQNLREEHGYTYGAHSSVVQEGTQTLLRISTAVKTEVTVAALAEIRRELARLSTGDVTADEVAKAVKGARHALVEAAQTTSGLAAVLATALADGRGADALRRDAEALGAVDVASVNAAAKSGLCDPEGFAAVFVGDETEIRRQFDAAGEVAPETLARE